MMKYDNLLARCYCNLKTTVWLASMYSRFVSDWGIAHWIEQASGVLQHEWAPRNFACLVNLLEGLVANAATHDNVFALEAIILPNLEPYQIDGYSFTSWHFNFFWNHTRSFLFYLVFFIC